MTNQEFSTVGGRGPRQVAVDYFVLAVAAWSSPLQVWANNPVGVGHPERLIVLGAVPWMVSILGTHVAMAFGVRRGTAVGTAFTGIIVLTRGAPIALTFGALWGAVAGVTIVAIVGYLISRRKSHELMASVFIGASLVLIGGAIGSLYTARASMGTDVSLPNDGQLGVQLTETPDIFVIFTDGYAGRITLTADFETADPLVVDTLRSKGFEIPKSAWSAFSSTAASIPSILDMSYPVASGPGIDTATKRTLYETIGGRNRLVAELSEAGYRVVMIESGWSGSLCGPEVDTCVYSPFLDEAVWWALSRSIVWPLILDSFGYSFTVGALGTMDWLLENAQALSSNGTPDLVLGHLMVPHPPLFLDASCEHRYEDNLSGVTLLRNDDDVGQRKAAYLNQASCVDGFMVELADQIADDAVVVYVADHGTDLRRQLVTHPTSWEDDGVRERQNVFLAVRNGSGCSIGDPVLLPNLMRRVLSCLAEEPIEELEPRMFKYAGVDFDGRKSPVVEVEPSLVSELLGRSE